MDKLKPCPFCSNEITEIHTIGIWNYVHCSVCNFDGEGDLGLSSASGAIALWNARPIEDRLTARIDKLEEALKFYANEHNYEKGHFTSEREVMADYGEKAREALRDPD